ncbi:energy transducer TonB [Mucilaginibacter sp. dw_454]|uniref:energy transducer TonB n=1 Tax=Mucilaginibacter sp. dw_454 TaxID=2720079 RepID=UPI001BD4D2DC|nr:energy transducer TonB [Mucilaginibacter sp. dw_454]
MKPITFIAMLLCVAATNSFAQKYSATTLYRSNGREVFDMDSADYIQVVSAPDEGSNLFNVQQYYKDKTRKLIAKSKDRTDIAYEGQVQTFYPSGKKHELLTYVNGEKVGDDYEYYPNGKLYAHKKYLADKKNGTGDNVLLWDCRDSTGTVLATGGEGIYRVYANNFAFVFEEGPVKAGLKEGEWKGTNGDKTNNLTFTEQYNNGVLKSGKAVYAAEGKTYDYTSRYQEAEYPGGETAFNRYIDNNVVYPAVMRANRTQAQLIVQFSVLPDGSLSDFNIIHSPHYLFSEAATKVLKSSPKWKPGYAFGKPMKVTNEVAVNFRL